MLCRKVERGVAVRWNGTVRTVEVAHGDAAPRCAILVSGKIELRGENFIMSEGSASGGI